MTMVVLAVSYLTFGAIIAHRMVDAGRDAAMFAAVVALWPFLVVAIAAAGAVIALQEAMRRE